MVLCGYGTRYVTLREEHSAENIWTQKRDEVTGSWRKLHNEEIITCTLRQI
jgi:hypothetical protein